MKETHELDFYNKIFNGENINLIYLFKYIYSRRRAIVVSVLISCTIGLIFAFGSSNDFESKTTLMPETQESLSDGMSNLGGLASLAGISIESSQGGFLTPRLYPALAESLPFQIDIIHEPIHFSELNKVITSYDYFTKIHTLSLVELLGEYTIGLPKKVKNLIKKETSGNAVIIDSSDVELISMSKEDLELLLGFRERINVVIVPENGVIEVKVSMPDQYAAADLANSVVDHLTESIVSYQTNRACLNLSFLKEQLGEAEKEYKNKQLELSKFLDRNKNLSGARIKNEQRNLENEVNLAFELFGGLKKQVQQAEIRVEETTPAFTVLDPAVVPVIPSGLSKAMIMVIAVVIGVIYGLTHVLLRMVIGKIKKSFYENSH